MWVERIALRRQAAAFASVLLKPYHKLLSQNQGFESFGDGGVFAAVLPRHP
jgi:hypothetical protein